MSEWQSSENRLAAKRAEDKAKSEQAAKDEALARAKRDSEKRYTNLARKEEAVSRYKDLLGPQQNNPKQQAQEAPEAAKAPEPAGTPVEFYTWKDGAVGKLKILTEGEFTPIV